MTLQLLNSEFQYTRIRGKLFFIFYHWSEIPSYIFCTSTLQVTKWLCLWVFTRKKSCLFEEYLFSKKVSTFFHC